MLVKKFVKDFQSENDYPIVLIKKDNKILELTDTINDLNNIEFITIQHPLGFAAYKRSIQFLMIKAFYKVIGKENIDTLKVLFSLGDSLYSDYSHI